MPLRKNYNLRPGQTVRSISTGRSGRIDSDWIPGEEPVGVFGLKSYAEHNSVDLYPVHSNRYFLIVGAIALLVIACAVLSAF